MTKVQSFAITPLYLPLTAMLVLLPAPFLSTQRRARAFSHAPAPVHSPLSQIPNPSQFSTPGRMTMAQTLALSPAFLNTPPSNPALVNKFRLRGSVTDPAQPRRRATFGQVSVTSS